MFRFAVRYLRWLAHVPLAAQLFDALLLTWTAVFHREILRAIETLEESALRLPGVRPARHRFGGLGFVRDGIEFAHVHGNGLLDVKLGRECAAKVVAAGQAGPHHVFGPSAWISFQLHTPDDCGLALSLLRMTQVGTFCTGEPPAEMEPRMDANEREFQRKSEQCEPIGEGL